jgi:hypothetical protein
VPFDATATLAATLAVTSNAESTTIAVDLGFAAYSLGVNLFQQSRQFDRRFDLHFVKNMGAMDFYGTHADA